MSERIRSMQIGVDTTLALEMEIARLQDAHADALGWLRSIGTTLGCEGDERAILEAAQAIMFERHGHAREVERARLEAKIEALDDLWVCMHRDANGNAVECEWYNNVTPDSVRLEVARLAAELAALEVDK